MLVEESGRWGTATDNLLKTKDWKHSGAPSKIARPWCDCLANLFFITRLFTPLQFTWIDTELHQAQHIGGGLLSSWNTLLQMLINNYFI